MNKVLTFIPILVLLSCGATQTTIIENGKEAKGHLKNGLKNGTWTFYKAGKVDAVGTFVKDQKNGDWSYFYDNGKLHQKGEFRNGKQNGIWQYYFDNGSFMGMGELVDGKQNGVWKWYHKNGNLYTERWYVDGKLMEIKSCFDSRKNVLDCGTISNGNGTMLFHDIENESDTIQEFQYKNGVIKNE
ncbi:hypothetical protein E6C50_02935 [Flavobacterium supellecticarium]|uniref:Toxin-antitoxin system YwqK family antitoxin n=1 Tax=Flavobacterium supellecticarium TaxID=2565924 RepID=A0A4S4A4G3_9FLAO|nr:hypothetical protein [Flavobacterium supellecticarium]THF53173.1 hypothetical protein E6C50_02935 [Flavobacterium supellecticarium]